MKTTLRPMVGLLALVALVGVASLNAADGPPSYTLQFLGDGSVVAINNADTVAGVRTSPGTGVQTPLVSVAGGAWTTLPMPAGATGALPTDLNDSGVIVGVASMSTGRRAIRWTPNGAGYGIDVIPLLPGELANYATGINNFGQVVGARAGILGTPYGFGWLYTDAGGLVDLNAAYGWFATPNDINDNGVILAGTQTFDLVTRTVTDIGQPAPTGYNTVGGVAINNAGQIAGSASLRSMSLNVISVFRYSPGPGWEFISGSSRYTVANDINNRGDIGWGELGAGVSFADLGNFALGSLLAPATVAAGWTITGNGGLLNDQRVVATIGRNTITAQSGAVLLTPAGQLPTPAAPTSLSATPHPATSSEPYMSINLSWNNGDVPLTRTYELERRIPGHAAWTPIPLVPPAMSTFHQDTTVDPATTYDYRVRAVGVAGPGPWSAIATASAPASALDTTPPEVSILTPTNGANVSGIVSVSAQASDNVGVANLQISYWNQYLGREIILAAATNTGSLAAIWDARALTPATYALWVLASDAIGYWKRAEISVNMAAAGIRLTVSSHLSHVGGNMILSWPTNADAFRLQSALIANPMIWSNAPQTRHVNGTNFSVTVPIAGPGAVYRLMEQ